MRFYHPKTLCWIIPVFAFIVFLWLWGVDSLCTLNSNHPNRSPTSSDFFKGIFLLGLFVIGYVGGVLVLISSMLWAVICLFLRFDGKRPILSSFLLIFIAFLSMGLLSTALDTLHNLPGSKTEKNNHDKKE